MSYKTITIATNDQQLFARVAASLQKEAWTNATLGETSFAQDVKLYPDRAAAQMMWPVCIDTEAAYESALIAGRSTPGGDADVITDASILAAIQAHWPEDQPAMMSQSYPGETPIVREYPIPPSFGDPEAGGLPEVDQPPPEGG